MKKKITSLYIHIPFCRHLCDYCDFTKMFYLPLYVKDYIKHLVKQIYNLKERKYKTIYIGGGTPTSLSPSLLEELLKALYIHKGKNTEFTIEVNPETMTKKKLLIMKKYGVNRVSLGVQTFDADLLKIINRFHSKRQVVYWINQFNKEGIKNINIDLIYGLPTQTLEKFKKDLLLATKLNITHISSYSLTVSKGTRFYNMKVKEVADDISREYYDLLYKVLKSNGFKRYEISNFAKNKNWSRHNLNYWNGGEYTGLGLGSHGYEEGVRYQNSTNIQEYLKGHYIVKQEKLTKKEKIEEYIMLGLRKENGLNKESFKREFREEIHCIFKNSLPDCIQNNLLCETKYSLKATYEGKMLLDQILIKMFLDL